MKKKFIFSLIIIAVFSTTISAQSFSLSDSSTIFKNQERKILNSEELNELLKGSFSMRKESADGKQIITILPSVNDETAKRNALLDAFKANLINKPIPPFKIPGLDYRVWESNQLRGRVIVMNFWFTTCGPCIKEMPVLNELVADYTFKNVVFLAPAPEKATQIKKFLKRNSFKYNIIPAALPYINQLQIENFPTHLLIDKKGIIREVFIGYDHDIKEKLQTTIDKLLKER